MKNILSYSLSILMITLFLSSCTQKNTVIATIEGIANDTVFVTYTTFTGAIEKAEPARDTVIAHNNTFAYNLPEGLSDYVNLYFEPQSLIEYVNGEKVQTEARTIMVIVQPGEKIKITGKIEGNYVDYQVVPSVFNKELAEQRSLSKNQYMAMDKLEYEIDKNPEGENVEALSEEYGKVAKEVAANRLDFIKANLNNDLAAYYLTTQPLDTFAVYYPQLTDVVKNGMYNGFLAVSQKKYLEFQQKKQNEEKIQAGNPAPNFTLKDLSGNDVSLYDLKDKKYHVLDFWGSWCIWCIRGYPHMKEYYNKYKDKVEFVGIACRDKEADWRKAVDENGLTWTQLFNAKTDDLNKDVSVIYAIKGYPSKIILDPDMKIVEVFLGESNEFYVKLDELMK